MSKIFKWIFLTAAAFAAIAIIACLYFYTHDYASYFTTTKGKLIGEQVAPFKEDSSFTHSWLTLKNDHGFTVQCGLLVPRAKPPLHGFPVVILLGGKATGKYAIDYVMDIRNVIIVSPDYPYNPRESYTVPQFISDVPAMRKAALDMIPSVMLVTDYLWQRPDVDTTKIILLGYSFGAPFVPCIVAHDHRAAVAAMVFGGGDLRGMIRYNVRRYRGPILSEFVADLSAILLRPLEPLRYADRISPVPFIVINGSEDEQIPREYTEEFYEKAKQPKKIIWLEARHVNPRNVELTRLIVLTLKEELVRMRLLSKDN